MFKTNTFSRILIFLYLVIPYLPLFGEIDRIASQWFFISVLNFISMGFIFYSTQDTFIESLKEKHHLAYLIFLICAIISAFFAFNYTESLVEIFRYSSVYLGIILFYHHVKRTESNLNYLMIIIFIFMIIEASGLIFQTFNGLPTIGFTGNKNIASASLMFKISFGYYMLYKFNNVFAQFMIYCVLTICYLQVFIVGSKAGILSVIITTMLFISYSFLNIKKNYITLFGVFSALTASVLNFMLNNNIGNAVYSAMNYTIEAGNTDRLRYYGQAISAFLENPFFGIGVGNWKIYSVLVDAPFMKNYIVQYHAHNDYLQLLAEVGLVGALFYLAFVLGIFYKSLKYITNGKNQKLFILSICCLSAITVYLIDSNLNFPAARIIMQLNLMVAFTVSSILFKGLK